MSPRGARLSRAVVTSAALLAATTLGAAPAVAAPISALAPLLPPEDGVPNGGYLVVLKPGAGTPAAAAASAGRSGAREVHRFRKVMNGFSAKLDSAALRAVRANPAVAYVRADSTVKAELAAPAAAQASATQTTAPWGLDRIDQRYLPLNNRYSYDTTGAGVTVFVADTGIRQTHVEFEGRATGVYSVVDDENGTADCRGHGTHVAGTIGGKTFGVAKNVQIRAVRVLDCEGKSTVAGLIEAMDWIASHAPPRSVANFSLKNISSEVNAAAERLIAAGVPSVFAAGNASQDACGNGLLPAGGIQVGGTASSDERYENSNYGPCVDIWAPASQINSAGHTSDTESRFDHGTSMAAPHVTGWLARYLEAHPTATPAQAKAALLSSATTGALTGLREGSPDRMLYAAPPAGLGDTTPPSTPSTPAASDITSSSAKISWTASTDDVGVTGYEVEYRLGESTHQIKTVSTTATAYAFTRLEAGAPYRMRVRAFDAAGNHSAYSPTVALTTALPPAPSNCTVTYRLNSGGSTFTANLSITNTGTTPISNWTLGFTLPAGHAFSQGWSAAYTQSGQDITATAASWNSTINPSQSVSVGFNGIGAGTATPAAFILNGGACSIA